MNTISLLSSVELPGGLWTSLINWFHSGIGNLGWTILLMTIAIRLITSPLDFWSKLNSKRQSLIQQKCAPQIAKIKKKFGTNQQAIRVQTNALYKREGLNTGVGCLVTLLHLVLTLVIFFSFYGSLRTNSAYQAINQYEILETTYNDKAYEVMFARAGEIDEYAITNNNEADAFVKKYVHGRELANPTDETENNSNAELELNAMTDEEYLAFYEKFTPLFEEIAKDHSSEENYPLTGNVYAILIAKNSEIEGYEITDSASAENFVKLYQDSTIVYDNHCKALYQKYEELMTDVQTQAENVTLDKWDSIKSNWIWVENIWVADAPTQPFLTYSGLVTIAKGGGETYSNYVNTDVDQNSFTAISNLINEKGSRTQNGYYILAILAAGLTFLSQYIAELHNKLKNKKAKNLASATMDPSMNMSMKWMKFIMPVIIILFVIRSSASFGIYIVASNISAILLGELINLLINKFTGKKQKEVEEALEKEANRLIKKGKLQEKK